MKLRKLLAAIAALPLALVVASAAQAGPPRPGLHGHAMGWERGGLRTFLDLKLSESQQTEMTNILNRYQEKREGLRGTIREARKEVSGALRAEPFSEEAARKAFRKASALREEWFVLQARMTAELKALLTPEQQALLKEQRAKRTERAREGLRRWLESAAQ